MQLDALAILDEVGTKVGDDDEDDSVESIVENAHREQEERTAAEDKVNEPTELSEGGGE